MPCKEKKKYRRSCISIFVWILVFVICLVAFLFLCYLVYLFRFFFLSVFFIWVFQQLSSSLSISKQFWLSFPYALNYHFSKSYEATLRCCSLVFFFFWMFRAYANFYPNSHLCCFHFLFHQFIYCLSIKNYWFYIVQHL